jgi:chorismate dehydratase
MRKDCNAAMSTGPARHAIGCVSFLNSKPLIEPLVGRSDVEIHFAVPAKLLQLVDTGVVSTVLLPVVDYQRSHHDLLLVPAGAIGCDGPTLTVRIYSKAPLSRISTLFADPDSHTSVILAQVLLRECFGIRPAMMPLRDRCAGEPETMLLIGDKVVNAAPDPAVYCHQLDLGEAWKRFTGLPFVFACWMMRADMLDQGLADLLGDAQRQGATMTETLLDKYAEEKRWPRDLARRYFTQYLRYEVTPQGRAGMMRFFDLAAKHGLLTIRRDLQYLELSPVG